MMNPMRFNVPLAFAFLALLFPSAVRAEGREALAARVIRRIRAGEDPDCERTWKVLAGLGPPVVPLVAGALPRSSWFARSLLLRALAESDAPEARSLVLDAARDPSWAVREVTATALWRHRTGEAAATLIALAGDPSWRVRAAAAVSLRRLATLEVCPREKAVPVLLTLAPYRSHRYLVGGLGLLVPLMVGGLALVPATLRRTRRGGLVAGALLLACASLFHQQGWLKLPWNDALLARGATGEPRELRWGPWRCQWSQPAPQRLPPPERVLLAQVVDWTGDDGWALAAWNTGDDWRPVVAAGEALLFTGGRQVPSSRLDDAYLSYLQRLPLDMLLVVAPGGSGVEEALRAAFPALECSSLATFRAIMEREDHGVWDFTWDVPHSKGPIRALVLGQRPSLRLSLHRCPLHPSSILPPR